jgi:hypothetical protein
VVCEGSSVWFGTRGSEVQILSPRPFQINNFQNRRECEDFQKDLHSRCRHRLRQKFAPHRSGSHAHSFNSFFPPCAIVDILRHVYVGVSHVVPRHFRPDASAAHRAGMHGAKAPEIGGSGQSKLFDRRLELPPQQIPPVHRTTFCVRENQVARISMFEPLPRRIQHPPQDSVRIERNAPATSIGFGIVEFAFVETLHDFDSIRMDSLPTQSRNLSDPQRTHDHQGHERFGGFSQPFDDTAYILLCEHNRRLPCLLAWQPDALCGIGANQFPRYPLIEQCPQAAVHVTNRFGYSWNAQHTQVRWSN